MQQQAEEERLANEQAAAQAQVEQAPIEVNLAPATVSTESTAAMASQMVSAIQNALQGRDQGIVDTVVNQFMNQFLDEMKRSGL